MRILVLHDRIDGEVRAAEADVLVQRDVVCAALRALGHHTSSHGCGLDLQDVADHLHAVRPDLVFNLVESIARTGRLIHLVPGVLDALHVRYTGATDGTGYGIAATPGQFFDKRPGYRTPIAGLAELESGRLSLRGLVLSPDGKVAHETARSGTPGDAIAMGQDAGRELLAKAGPDFLGVLR